jgi:RNA polymerase sigma-70 factor (ECF subfamily)
VEVTSLSSDSELRVHEGYPPPGVLVEAASRGDDDAFESLVRSRLERTYRIALATLGSEADARDAVQETWVAVWRHLPSLTDPSRFDSWVDSIVVNSCRMTIRKRGRIREIALVDDLDRHASGPGPDDVPERDALDRAFGRLSVEHRSILVLHHLERQPVSAIAEMLRIPVGTAKSRLFAARTALERELEAER